MRRELWETIVDLLEAVASLQTRETGLHITSLMVDLPVEVLVRQTAVGFTLLADLPQSRWTEGLTAQPGRMQLHLSEVAHEA
jgi:hypothetical protein